MIAMAQVLGGDLVASSALCIGGEEVVGMCVLSDYRWSWRCQHGSSFTKLPNVKAPGANPLNALAPLTIATINRLHRRRTGQRRSVPVSKVSLPTSSGYCAQSPFQPDRFDRTLKIYNGACSPQARGWNRVWTLVTPSCFRVPRRRVDGTGHAPMRPKSTPVFPAGVGMNRPHPDVTKVHTRVPRRRGDEPVAIVKAFATGRSSPPARWMIRWTCGGRLSRRPPICGSNLLSEASPISS